MQQEFSNYSVNNYLPKPLIVRLRIKNISFRLTHIRTVLFNLNKEMPQKFTPSVFLFFWRRGQECGKKRVYEKFSNYRRKFSKAKACSQRYWHLVRRPPSMDERCFPVFKRAVVRKTTNTTENGSVIVRLCVLTYICSNYIAEIQQLKNAYSGIQQYACIIDSVSSASM